MGNQSSATIHQRDKRLRKGNAFDGVVTVAAADPNFFESIDEEAAEANEDTGPLSITSTSGDVEEEEEEEPVNRGGGLTRGATFSQLASKTGISNKIVASSEPHKPGFPKPLPLLQPPKRRTRSTTLGSKEGNLVRQQIISRQRIPTVFKLYWSRGNPHQPLEVSVGGSFNQWSLVPMNGSQGGVGHWCIIIDLPEGVHEYKFKVDDQWVHNPKERTVDDGCGGRNNVITVHRSDFEVFEALDMDTRDVAARKKSLSMYDDDRSQVYSQVVPSFADPAIQFFEQLNGNDRGPPILPPHLLQVILNKDTPLSCEPTLLPMPNHVMLNHMYALSIKDRVMVMSTTQRFRKKYVTTVLYRPISA